MTESKAEQLEARVAELETRLLFQEDTLQALDDVVTRQDGEVALLRAQVQHLSEKLKELQLGSGGEGGSGQEERPPHY